MNFSRFRYGDIQSWWEVPGIAYFCSLFRTAFNLLDFDIEELEEALLTDGTEESASSLLTELIVRLLNGCLGNNDISAFNYQMYLRRLFRQKCQETGRYNPFNTDIDFQFLPLRTKVEILYALCDFRLDAEDVFDLFKNLEAESLRVEPLGWDDNYSAYWYFYGTRLYREDIIRKPKGKNKKKKLKEGKKRSCFFGDVWLNEDEADRVWQVVCFTEEDWTHLTEKFSKATSKVEKELYRSLSQNFLPEIPRLFQEKERLQRKRLLELAPRRTSNRVLQKIKKEEGSKQSTDDSKEEDDKSKDMPHLARENRAKRRNLLRSKSASSDSSSSSEEAKEVMPQKVSSRSRSTDKRSKNSSATNKGEPPPEPPVKPGRKTNNSLASVTGQILIPDNDEPVSSTRKKLKTSQIFSQTEEDIQTDMYKVLEQITAHDDAWPFMDPVEEEYAPNYYAVIRRPMDLHKMEERLDSGHYTDFSMFKADFKLIVNNCRLYNGQDNEYTTMVDNLQVAFDKLTEKYMHRMSSSDEEIAVEYQLPTPSRKHKLKPDDSPEQHKRKKQKSLSEGEPKSSSSEIVPEEKEKKEKNDKELEKDAEVKERSTESKKSKESHKNKQERKNKKEEGIKKKRKGHHRHGKHSKNHKKTSHKTGHSQSKSKHSKKHKEGKSKDGKKSKQKKKKSRRHLAEIAEVSAVKLEAASSPESSHRSRSASPLPSIHTPSPSPTELDQPSSPPPPDSTDQLTDPDFFKDKYDKIKERRRHAAKDAFESLFDLKQKEVEKHKQHGVAPDKDKHQKLRETIEKLKAKNEKFKESSVLKDMYSPGSSGVEKQTNFKKSKDTKRNSHSNNEETEEIKGKERSVKTKTTKKIHKKSCAKNESASEALEEAVKDISKWLEEPLRSSAMSSPCDSPAQTTISTEEQDSRQDDELSQGEKSVFKKEMRKRPSSREPKVVKRREIQRTIERLQPGKSKGNLLTNISNKNIEKADETTSLGVVNKVRETVKSEEASPKLSLGSVLPTVEFTLGKDHNFDNREEPEEKVQKEVIKEPEVEVKENKAEDNTQIENKPEEPPITVTKKDAEVETEPQAPPKPNQEKATPNLSAWFKAFGAPKNPTPTTTVKKKTDEAEGEEKQPESTITEQKPPSPKNPPKYDSPTDPEALNPEGGDSPVPVNATPRQRRTSTGSSVSERSSFSQDLDSPRHQMSHTSPLLRSPASPRNEEFQKITYPIINGSVRAGFYQDTTSMKSSPEKSCSPREGPQSPYSAYPQHVYAINNPAGASTPNYFVDHNKSPLPTYTHNPPLYYDTTKAAVVNKPPRAHEDFTNIPPETFQQNQYARPYSPVYSPYTQPPSSNYSQVQQSPQPPPANTTSTVPPMTDESKTAHFPVKKRMYNEPDQSVAAPTKPIEPKDPITAQVKSDFSKITQPPPHATHHPHSIPPMNTPSVDDIALALCEKSEMAKLRENNAVTYAMNERLVDNRNTQKEHIATVHDLKKDMSSQDLNKAMSNMKKDNIDMVNMGYMNPEVERRSSSEAHEGDFSVPREVAKPITNTPQKVYDVDAIALNLGISSQALQKTLTKTNATQSNIPPAAHSHDRSHVERSHADMSVNHNVAHAHHPTQYDHMSSGQAISNFSMSDIELANKKLYACNAPTSTAIDYGNWKMTNQMRKPDMMPSDYSTNYNANSAEKLKNEINAANTINYNKNIQHQQYMFNAPRSNTQRTQDLQQSLPAELRIPNPRGHLKNDHINVSSVSDPESVAKNMDILNKSQKTEKLVQNHPLVSSNPYKTPYSNSGLPIDTLRNLPNIPQMLERYTNDDRFLSSFASSSSSLYHEKQYQMAQMFNKSLPSEIPSSSTSASILYSQPSTALTKDNGIYKTTNATTQDKPKTRRKRTVESKPAQVVSSQGYHGSPCTSDVLSSVKSGMMPTSAFNFGTSSNMALSSGLYGDNAGFSANQLMAANYMVAAVAHQQRSTEPSGEKMAKPAHAASTTHAAGSFPFIGHGQVRGGYPFVGSESTSPLYQQYLQRHQEELLRQTGAQIMSLYPAGYPPPLAGVRQPYDTMNRHWL